MIVYANATGLDIGKLFAAGILPGVLLGICYMVTGVIYAKKRNIPKIPFQGLKHVGKTFVRAIWALLMPIIIIGGILGGFFTATECGVIATLYGIAYGLIARRLKVREIWDSLRDGIMAAVGPISLIAISSIFSYMLAREGVTGAIADFVTNNIHSQFGVLAFVSIICIIAGCFVDGTATMLLLTPIFLPVVQAMNIDVLQFSMIFMIVIMSGGHDAARRLHALHHLGHRRHAHQPHGKAHHTVYAGPDSRRHTAHAHPRHSQLHPRDALRCVNCPALWQFR